MSATDDILVVDPAVEAAALAPSAEVIQPDEPVQTLGTSRPAGRVPSRPLPHSLEAEEYLLSCCLLDGADVVARCIHEGITARSFYDGKHGTIFAALRSMHERGDPIDTSTLAEHLKADCKLEHVGGYGFIAQVSSRLPTTAQASHFVRLVADYATRRELDHLASELAENVSNLSLGTDELVGTLRGRIDAIVSNGQVASGLDARLFDLAKPPPPADPRYFLRGVPVWTAGNLGALSAKVKTGKSAVIGAQLSAVMLPAGSEADCLGFTASPNSNGHAVVHLDTEQSPDDHHGSIKRCLARARLTTPPPWLLSYCLTGMQAAQIRAALLRILDRAARRFGGVHSVFVDGVADLAADVNDPAEANALVAEWHAVAIRFHAPLVGVIHVNPGETSNKTRGHLGSQLERKAETNMRIDMEDDGVSLIHAEKNRRAPIYKRNGVRFAWDDRAAMHVSVTVAPDPELVALARNAFEGEGEIGANAAIRAIKDQEGFSEGTAKNRWREIVAQGIAVKNPSGKYRLI